MEAGTLVWPIRSPMQPHLRESLRMSPVWSLEGEFRGFETCTFVDRRLPTSDHAWRTRSPFQRQAAFGVSAGLRY
jgi:hypothetical protein